MKQDYRVKEAAEFLGVTGQSVHNYIKQGLLKAKKTFRGFLPIYIIDIDDLIQFKDKYNF